MLKRCAIITLPGDLKRVQKLNFRINGYEPICCTSLTDLHRLPPVQAYVYVLTELATHATSYQAMVLELLATLPPNAEQWLLNLDEVEIPTGFSGLEKVPPGPPGLRNRNTG